MIPVPAKKKKSKRTFGKGGKGPGINNPDTHHGTYDLPNASVRSYSEKAKPMKFAKGGSVESKAMVKKEIGFMKKKGAPKSMIKHEEAEAKGMKKMAGGGMTAPSGVRPGSSSASRARPPVSSGRALPGSVSNAVTNPFPPRGTVTAEEVPPRGYVTAEEVPGMKRGGMACGGMKKYAAGGAVSKYKKPYIPSAGDINEKAGGDQEMKMREEIAERNRNRGPGRGPLSRNGMKDKPFGYARGGGVESHGKTKGTMIKMASGGSVSARADGVAQRGKTNCKIC